MRLPARIGLILVVIGALIFVGQVASLMWQKPLFERRGQVLVGAEQQTVGARDVRPALSVIGVACVAGGLFAMALGGGRKV